MSHSLLVDFNLPAASPDWRHEPWWVPKRRHEPELIDFFDQPVSDLRKAFREIATFNRLFGGTSVVIDHLSRLAPPKQEPLSILDVASGFGDIPREMLRWAKTQDIQARIVCLDANRRMLELAKEESDSNPNLSFVEADARCLPYPDDTFDFATCSLALHHFDDQTALTIIREMIRVSKRAVIVNDLRREYLPASLIWLITRALFMNRLVRHDAHLSVLKARTMREYRALAQAVAGPRGQVFKHAFWRAAIVVRKSE